MKTIKHSCDNPKLGAGKSMGKGYRDGGQVPMPGSSPSRNTTRVKSSEEQKYNKSEYRNTPQKEVELRQEKATKESAAFDVSTGGSGGGSNRGGGGGGGGLDRGTTGGGGGGGSTSVGNFGGGASEKPDFDRLY